MRQKIERDKVFLSFAHLHGGLTTRGGKEVKGFQVAGRDQVFHPAKAWIEGNEVVVRSARVSRPVAVRYGWAGFPECNLYNQAGLPAPPFRTDSWPPPPDEPYSYALRYAPRPKERVSSVPAAAHKGKKHREK